MGLIASMESIDNGEEVVAAPETEQEVTAVAVADESAEIQADGAEIGTTVSEVEEAVQAGEELETIGEQVDASIESGEGMDEATAEMASIAIESIRNRIGDYSVTRIVAARESFGNSNTRLTSTRLIKEGITDTIKKIWLAIKAATARVWEMIRSFFAKLFSSSALLEKNIAALKARADKMPADSVKKEEKIKTGIAKEFSIKGVADLSTYEKVGKNTAALADVSNKVAQLSSDILNAAMPLTKVEGVTEEAMAEFGKKQVAVAGQVQKILEAGFTTAAAVLGNEANALVELKKKQAQGEATVAAFGPFVGSAVLMLVEKTVKDAKIVSMTFDKAKSEQATEVQALSLAEVKSVLAIAADYAKKVSDFKKVQSAMDGNVKAISKCTDAVLANAGKIQGGSKEANEAVGKLRTEVNSSIRLLQSFGSNAPMFVFNMAKAGADYASVSMRNLGAKAAA